MLKYILKRILYMILTLWVIATVTFVIVNSIPGDPIRDKAKALPEATVKALSAKYNLDKPKIVRYGLYLEDLVHGDLGMSIQYPGRTVNDMISKEFPVSAKLGLQAVVLGTIIGVILGILAAFNRGRWPDYLVIFIALVGVSIPGFVFAILLQYILGGKFGIPTAGWFDSGESWILNIRYTILPTFALALGTLAGNARFMRSSVLDVINQDYILTAKAKGVNRVGIVTKHILRNAIIPIVTNIGPSIAALVTGTIVIEGMFGIPGIGRDLFNAINYRDYTVVMSLTIFISFIYVVALLLVDIAYVLVDPRIKLASSKN